jgi:general secretion pathway protein K
MTASPARPGSRGFALLIVLWSLAILALLGTRLTATAVTQLRVAADARNQAQAEAAADGAIRQAMFVLLGGGEIGTAAAPMRVRIGGAVVDVVAVDQAGKINPNSVSPTVLRGLLAALGVDPPLAARLAGEIADWRNRSVDSSLGGKKIDAYRDRGLPYRSGDHRFLSVDEIGLVADMTPEILDRLRPWLSVYQEGDVKASGGASPVAAAIGDARMLNPAAGQPLAASRNVILRVTATAVLRGPARFVRSAVLRMRASPGPQPARVADLIQVLAWE